MHGQGWALLPLGLGVASFAIWMATIVSRKLNAPAFDSVILKCVRTGRTDRALKLTRVAPKAIYAAAMRAALEAMQGSGGDADERTLAGKASFDVVWSNGIRALDRDRWVFLLGGLFWLLLAAAATWEAGGDAYWLVALVLPVLALAMDAQVRRARAGFDRMAGELGELIAKEPPAEEPVKKTKPAPVVAKTPFRVQSEVHDPCARCGGMRIAQLDGVSIDGMPAARLVAYFCRDCGTGLFEVDPADLPAGDDVRGMPRRKPN